MINNEGDAGGVHSKTNSPAFIVIVPSLVLALTVIADFGLAKSVGVVLSFDALIQRMLYASVQSALGYWVGWKMFRPGAVPAQWHIFGVLISAALAGALYLCAQLFIGARNMPSFESGWAVLFNISVGLLIALYLAMCLSSSTKSSAS